MNKYGLPPMKLETRTDPPFFNGAAFDFTVSDGEITYTPWTNGREVGFRVTYSDGRKPSYVYLSPVPKADRHESLDHAYLWSHQGPTGDPKKDGVGNIYRVDWKKP